MKRNRSKMLSLLLAFSMVVSMLVVPAAAADNQFSITADYNGEEVYREDYPENYNLQSVPLLDLGVGVDVKVVVTSGTYTSSETSARPISMTGTLPNGTVYRLTEDSSRVVSLTTTNSQLKDDVHVSVTTTPHNYSISANSGPKDFKDNLGSTSNPTCSVSAANQTVAGNTSWDVTFAPNAGLTITHLNIRSILNSQNIVSASTGKVTIGNTQMTITKAANGFVTVHADHAADNIYVTALTAEKPAQYTLSVSTNGHVTSDTTTATLESGTTKKVTLTADSGYLVDTITINDGGKTATLSATATSVSVNGHSYSVTRGIDGKVVLSIPAISANVSINATASNTKAYLQVVTDSNIDSNYPSLSYLNKGSSYTVRLDPDWDAEITSVKVESATDSVILHGNEYRFALDGVYYRVDTRADSSMVLYFSSMPGNLKITAYSKDTWHTITLDADGGADYEGNDDEIRIEDGGSETVAFIPDTDCTIEELVFTYSGNTYRVDSRDTYIRINGTRCPIVWETNGRVSVTLYDVSFDIKVKAVTDYDGKDFVITLNTDGGADFSGSSRVYVNRGSSKTITFTPEDDYEIEELIITRNGNRYYVNHGDTSITISGTRHTVKWYSNGKVSITLKNVTADMTVYAETDYDGVIHNPGVDYPEYGDYQYHVAYIEGYGNGMFGPNNTTTRAGAVVMLMRAFYGATNQSVSNYGYSPYADVPANAWYAGYIAYAYNQGLLTGLHGVGTNFRPLAPITRAEYAELLCRFTGVTPTGNYGYVFPDVPANHWSNSAVGYAASRGWVYGFGDGLFRPDNTITRAQLVTMTNRVLGRSADRNYVSTNFITLNTFLDVPPTYWAYYDILEACNGHYCNYYSGVESWGYY